MLQQSRIANVVNMIGACVKFVHEQFVKRLRLETKSEPRRPLLAYEFRSLSVVEIKDLDPGQAWGGADDAGYHGCSIADCTWEVACGKVATT